MTPEDLRSSVDDSWPVEIRFLIESAASSWEKDIRHQEELQYKLIACVFSLTYELKSGLFKRIRAKSWKMLVNEVQTVCIEVVQGFRYFSAKNKDNGPQEKTHPETNVPSLSRTKA
jgi:hypothetical protein